MNTPMAVTKDIATAGSDLPPFYYGCVFWGQEYRDYFLRFCLPSMLSGDNIPALNNHGRSRFFICTGRRDWEACQQDPIFKKLRQYVEPEFVELPDDNPTGREDSMPRMSWGHRIITQRAFEAGACGIIVTPDSIFSNGSMPALARRLLRGEAVIVAAALRFRTDTILADMKSRGLIRPGEPLNLSSRELVALALQHLHSETEAYLWETRHYWEPPVCSIWRGPEGDGLIIHSLSWGAMLIDYRQLARHDVSALEKWTMDGDYVFKNFGSSDLVGKITDSDEYLMISFTSEKSFHLPRYDGLFRHIPLLENIRKAFALRKFLYSDVIDPLKREMFMIPVRFHAGPITEAWQCKEEQTNRLLGRICHPPDWRDTIVARVIAGWRYLFGHPRALPGDQTSFRSYLGVSWLSERCVKGVNVLRRMKSLIKQNVH